MGISWFVPRRKWEPFSGAVEKAPELAVDTETTGLDAQDRLRLIQMKRSLVCPCC